MITEKETILIIDDEEIMRDVIAQLLVGEGYSVVAAASGADGLERIGEGFFDLALVDLMMPAMNGIQTLQEIKKIDSDLVVIMITAFASIENAVQATRLGAFDFVTKPFKNEELLLVINNGLQKRRLQMENRQLRRILRERSNFDNIIGKSDKMQKVFDLIAQVGPRRSTILIEGESGTGKELVAKAIHHASPRADAPFIPVNSGSIPNELLESELFGHVKGAFTGATSSKKGLFEVANGGTIFLDEVGTIPFETQAKLLRVIQEREFRRVGGLESIKVDVRIIAATNIDLKKAVAEKLFRDDLYYRLNVISIHLPPLRDRKIDIPLLADHFIQLYCVENGCDMCTLSPEALKVLMDYDWPGNVRELENVIERAVVLAPGSVITSDLFPGEVTSLRSDLSNNHHDEFHQIEDGVSLKDLVTSFERNLITTALQKTSWNQKRAASLLKLNPTTLNEKLKRLNIKLP